MAMMSRERMRRAPPRRELLRCFWPAMVASCSRRSMRRMDLLFFDLLPEPVLVVGARPAGQRLAAIVLGDGSALGETGPDEGIGVAGLEIKVGDIAVGGLGEEPLDEGRELPAVLNLEVDFVAQDGGQGGNCALRSDAGGALAFRARTYVLGSGGCGLFHCFVSMLMVDDCFYGRKSSPRPEKA
jgi:hypothetical protein